jgi:DNA-binding LacI/PurR family transcriptional regulator
MQDIADAAGVHVMTVSNALGNVRVVAPATREKVLKIAKELNYIPNSAARSLVVGRTGMIALVCGAINEPYYAQMAYFLESCMAEDGYKLTLLRRPHDVIDLINETGRVAVDGAIAIDMYHWADQFRAHPSVPCVAIGTYEHDLLDYVVVDMSAAIREALQIMVDEGRQRIAYVVDAPQLALPTENRARTYLDFMRRIGRSAEIIDIYSKKPNQRNIPLSRRILKTYFQRKGVPDALFCLNDEIAMCAYRALRDTGRRVPEDALLVGCDGQPHMEFFDPPLSTVAQPMEEMCSQAWQILRRRMDDPNSPLQHVTLNGTLLVRESLRRDGLTSQSNPRGSRQICEG